VASVTWIAWLRLDKHWKEQSPSMPIPGTQQVVPVKWGSKIVYMTSQEARMDSWLTWSGVIAVTLLAVFALWQRYNKRHQRP
jgi:hypothetical protein